MPGVERSFRLRCNPRTAFEAALEAVRDEGFEVVSDDPETGSIRAEKGVSLWSWGEEVDVGIVAEGREAVANVSSVSRAQIVDWGTNEVNVEKVGRRLTWIVENRSERHD
jgi:hypothetical protein